jgi:hypothetical protein
MRAIADEDVGASKFLASLAAELPKLKSECVTGGDVWLEGISNDAAGRKADVGKKPADADAGGVSENSVIQLLAPSLVLLPLRSESTVLPLKLSNAETLLPVLLLKQNSCEIAAPECFAPTFSDSKAAKSAHAE